MSAQGVLALLLFFFNPVLFGIWQESVPAGLFCLVTMILLALYRPNAPRRQ